MKYLEQLTASKLIVEATPFDVSASLDFFPTPELMKEALTTVTTVETYRIIYKAGKLKVVGYLAIPKQDGTFPCLIHLRGGARDFSMLTPRRVYGQLITFAAKGYVVISTQYPGVEGGDGADTFGGPDDIASMLTLKKILEVLPNTDTARIGVKGHSRGGLMTFMLLRQMKWIKAAVIAGAPVDQTRRHKERTNWRAHQISLWGKSKEETLKRSPLTWVNELPKKVPILLMHGTADWRVPPTHSLDMSRAMFEHKIPHRLILFEGADHGLTEYRQEYFEQTLHWFERFLKQDAPLPNLKPHGD